MRPILAGLGAHVLLQLGMFLTMCMAMAFSLGTVAAGGTGLAGAATGSLRGIRSVHVGVLAMFSGSLRLASAATGLTGFTLAAFLHLLGLGRLGGLLRGGLCVQYTSESHAGEQSE